MPLREGTHVQMRLRVGPLTFKIPCVVVWAERTAESWGFAYGTLPGHPERGEERFAVRLTPSGEVTFRIVAFSSHGRWFTRVGGPVARRMQRKTTERYLEALDRTTGRWTGSNLIDVRQPGTPDIVRRWRCAEGPACESYADQ